eukprot:m.148473 g.148473  ORF g.148473 m.148473 type:complete len:401 (-) comp24391_c1_seq2:1324-2526(-)
MTLLFLCLFLLFPEKINSKLSLVGGNFKSGRILLQGSLNGGICTDNWSKVETNLACRELGFFLGGESFVGVTDDSETFVMDDVDCSFFDETLLDCSFVKGSNVNCLSGEFVSITCKYDPSPELRIRGDGYSGLLEVLHNNEWRAICNHGFDSIDAAVACFTLGHSSLNPNFTTTTISSWDFWLSDVDCGTQDSNFTSCRHGDWGEHTCKPNEAVKLSCHPETSPDGQARILSFSKDASAPCGRLHMKPSDSSTLWQGVCADRWTEANNRVACRSAGLPSTSATYRRTAQSTEVGFSFNDVFCEENDTSLENCITTTDTADCHPYTDAVEVCCASSINAFPSSSSSSSFSSGEIGVEVLMGKEAARRPKNLVLSGKLNRHKMRWDLMSCPIIISNDRKSAR